MEEYLLPAIELTKELNEMALPSPQDYDYWQGRKSRVFYIDYEVDENYDLIDLSKTILQMNFAERNIPKEQLLPIYIFIHSYGGDLQQANFLADLILASRIPIYTIAMGVAMSAGFIIFLAGSKRYAFQHTQLLVHEGEATLQGTYDQVAQAQANYSKQIEEMRAYILDRTSIDEKTFNKYKKKDWYLSKDEIEKYGIATIIKDLSEIF